MTSSASTGIATSLGAEIGERSSSPLPQIEDAEPRAWLVGFRLDPDSEGEPDLYTLYIDADRPLVSARSIVFFANPKMAATALARDDDLGVRTLSAPDDVEIVYDVPMALYRLASEDVDEGGDVVNLLNVMFDLLKASEIPWIAAIEDVLYPFADHLTFSTEFGAYLEAEAGRRQAVIDAILWSIGAIATHSTMLRSAR